MWRVFPDRITFFLKLYLFSSSFWPSGWVTRPPGKALATLLTMHNVCITAACNKPSRTQSTVSYWLYEVNGRINHAVVLPCISCTCYLWRVTAKGTLGPCYKLLVLYQFYSAISAAVFDRMQAMTQHKLIMLCTDKGYQWFTHSIVLNGLS